MDERRRAFYEYHAAMMEPWDGPAAIVFTDGRQIGATLDRNGLRPARYCVTDDDLVVMASESGVLPIPENKIVKKWRLQPGKMFLIDLEQGRIIDDEELKASSSPTAKPYKQWIENVRIKLDDIEARPARPALPSREQPARPPAGLRLHAGRHQVPAGADGRRPARKASARWATTARWPCCRTRTSRCTTTSSSCSRR
jgi:glutamate synthase (NADPH/NADH) large chain/glutamate synthase (ferredoxin)